MSSEVIVTLAGLATSVGLAWFFFGPKEARRAEVRGGVQESGYARALGNRFGFF